MATLGIGIGKLVTPRRSMLYRAKKALELAEGNLLGRVQLQTARYEMMEDKAALAAAFACIPDARRYLLEALRIEICNDRLLLWNRDLQDRCVEEVVIGGGLHAAIYAASSRRYPLVIEKEIKPGGVFGSVDEPVFALNSRNRPGVGGQPGQGASLNYIPGGELQLADFAGAEYPSQELFGLAINYNLLAFSQVLTQTRVRVVESVGDKIRLLLVQGPETKSIYADRVVIATGLGEPTLNLAERNSSSVFTFQKFVKLSGGLNAYPLKGLKKVAVIGSGDSGNAMVGMLLGQEPLAERAPVSLDYVERIDWFGQSCIYAEEFKQARSRYAGIARYMERRDDPERYFRVYPVPGRTVNVSEGLVLHRTPRGDVVVKGPYDAIIVCTGFQPPPTDIFKALTPPFAPVLEDVVVDGEVVARKYSGIPVYRIGPCANISVAPGEALADIIPENSAAVFRYGSKTEKFAQCLK